jgi:hypothetical protein
VAVFLSDWDVLQFWFIWNILASSIFFVDATEVVKEEDKNKMQNDEEQMRKCARLQGRNGKI